MEEPYVGKSKESNGQSETRTRMTKGRHILSVVRLPISPSARSVTIIVDTARL